MWEKYWVFQGLQTLGKYDKETGKFSKRDKTTVYPFPQVEREYIFTTLKLMEDFLKDKKGEEEDKKGEETLETVEMSKNDMEKINKFMDAFEALSAKVEALEQENAELKEKLKNSKKEKTEFEKKAESTLDRLSSLISGQVNDKEKKEEQLASTSKVSGDMWG